MLSMWRFAFVQAHECAPSGESLLFEILWSVWRNFASERKWRWEFILLSPRKDFNKSFWNVPRQMHLWAGNNLKCCATTEKAYAAKHSIWMPNDYKCQMMKLQISLSIYHVSQFDGETLFLLFHWILLRRDSIQCLKNFDHSSLTSLLGHSLKVQEVIAPFSIRSIFGKLIEQREERSVEEQRKKIEKICKLR